MAKSPKNPPLPEPRPGHPPLPILQPWTDFFNLVWYGLVLTGILWLAGRGPGGKNTVTCHYHGNVSLALDTYGLFNQSYPTVQALCDDPNGDVLHAMYQRRYTPSFRTICIKATRTEKQQHIFARVEGQIEGQSCEIDRTVSCPPHRKHH